MTTKPEQSLYERGNPNTETHCDQCQGAIHAGSRRYLVQFGDGPHQILCDACMDEATNDAQLQAFRDIAAQMNPEPHDWQWIGQYMSQRMLGITRKRAEAYAARHGGIASPMAENGQASETAKTLISTL